MQLVRNCVSQVHFPIVFAALEIIGPDDLVPRAGEYVLHEYQMVGSLYLVALEGEEAIDLGQQRVGVPLVVLVKVHQVLLQELKLVLGDRL